MKVNEKCFQKKQIQSVFDSANHRGWIVFVNAVLKIKRIKIRQYTAANE